MTKIIEKLGRRRYRATLTFEGGHTVSGEGSSPEEAEREARKVLAGEER